MKGNMNDKLSRLSEWLCSNVAQCEDQASNIKRPDIAPQTMNRYLGEAEGYRTVFVHLQREGILKNKHINT